MLVVADTSPLVALVNIDCIHVLPALFGQVIIPTRVAEELARRERPLAVRQFIGTPPAWLVVRTPGSMQPGLQVHAGELEAISLAIELAADVLLIDDQAGRAAAIQLGLIPIRTGAVLLQAADQRLIDLQSAFNRLRQTDFRVKPATLEALLKQHEQRQGT